MRDFTGPDIDDVREATSAANSAAFELHLLTMSAEDYDPKAMRRQLRELQRAVERVSEEIEAVR